MSKIYVFGGGKGGVGKTTACLTLYHVKKSQGLSVFVREGDATNPDVARALALDETSLFNPSVISDWSDLLEKAKDGDVVVNLPGGGDMTFLENAGAMAEAAAANGNEIIFLFTLNRSAECVYLLKVILKQLEGSGVQTVAIVNEFFGEVARFARFNNSKTRAQLLDHGGHEVILPELNEAAFDLMISPNSAREIEGAPPLIRSIYKSWLVKAGKNFGGI